MTQRQDFKAEFTAQVRLFVAIELFRLHKLSVGKATELSGLSKELFKLELFRCNIPLINYSPDELEKELEILNQC
ncbi:MAG: UPF0175 family protein [Leptospiraceae bacterium]|nr:UPF0175 family protein [Leptospiraceae bacterium]